MYSSMYSSTGNSMYVLCARTFNYKKMVARASGSIQIHIIYTVYVFILMRMLGYVRGVYTVSGCKYASFRYSIKLIKYH